MTGIAVVAVAILAIVLGIGFRFYHIDRKVYWGDEAYTSLRILGRLESDLIARAPELRQVSDLQAIMHPEPPQGAADPFAAARVLAIEEPHHPPLYYELAHFWAGAFGNAVGTLRALSAVVSLLAFPLAFWLCTELYGSRLAGWIFAALLALSPVAVIYAQEAREYALWGVVLLALDAAVLRALRLGTWRAWTLVAALAALCLYTFTLTVFVLAGLALYVGLTRFRERTTLLRCGAAFAVGFAAYVPWLLNLVRHYGTVAASLSSTMYGTAGPGDVLRACAGTLRLAIVDLDFVRSSKLGVAATALALLTLGAALLLVARRDGRRTALFLLVPIVCTVVPLLVPDVLGGGRRVRNPRYFIATYISLELALTGAIAALLTARDSLRRLVGFGALLAVLTVGAASCYASAHATTWWSKMQDDSISVAAAVNATRRPLIAGDAYLDYALVLSNYLRPDIAVALRPSCYMCGDRTKPALDASVMPAGTYSDVFELGGSPRFHALLLRLLAAHPGIAYHCINIRHNCTSDLNVEPVFDSPR